MRFVPIRISLVISLLLIFSLQLMTWKIRDLYLGLNITLTPDTFTPVRSIRIASFENFDYVHNHRSLFFFGQHKTQDLEL